MTTPTPIPSALRGRPFRIAEANRLGLSRRTLQGPRFERITHDVYALADLARDPLVRAQAVQLINPVAVISHASAARVWQLPVSIGPVGGVTIPKGTRRIGRSAVTVHETRRPTSTVVHGWEVTPPDRTLLDLAATHCLEDLVVAGDSLVRRGLVTQVDLITAAAGARTPWAGTARRAAHLVRPHVDSPPETRTRLLLIHSGLPEPGTGYTLIDQNGYAVAWPDLDYRAYRIALEYDGWHHERDPDQRERDVRRRAVYRRLGWILIEVTAARLAHDPGGIVIDVHNALCERGAF